MSKRLVRERTNININIVFSLSPRRKKLEKPCLAKSTVSCIEKKTKEIQKMCRTCRIPVCSNGNKCRFHNQGRCKLCHCIPSSSVVVETPKVETPKVETPETIDINGITFKEGDFVKYEDKIYKIFSFLPRGDKQIVVLQQPDKNNSDDKRPWIGKYTYHISRFSPEIDLKDIKLSLVSDMTDEKFYVKPAPAPAPAPASTTTTSYDPRRYCSGGRDLRY